jgi:hypothetical protein
MLRRRRCKLRDAARAGLQFGARRGAHGHANAARQRHRRGKELAAPLPTCDEEVPMNFAHDFMNRLNDAAGRIGSGVRDWHDGRTAASIDRLRDSLVPALDQFVDALSRSGRALQAASAPYLEQIAESTRSGAQTLQENTRAGAQALGDIMQRRRGMFARHPYLIALTVVGIGYVAVQRWRQHAAAGTRRPRAASKTAKTASRSSARASTRTARGNARRQRPATSNAGNTEKAIH